MQLVMELNANSLWNISGFGPFPRQHGEDPDYDERHGERNWCRTGIDFFQMQKILNP